MLAVLETWKFSISQIALRCLLLHLLRIVFAFFALDHSPCARVIWILTTNLILLRRLQWRIDVLLLEGKQRVFPFYHPSIHQTSTLEKTKIYQYSILGSLMNVRFQRVGGARDSCHGKQRVSCSIVLLSLRTQRTLTFASGLHQAFWCSRWQRWWSAFPASRDQIVGLDFAVTLSSPESFCVLFDITSEHSAELIWLILNKHKDDSIRHVWNFPRSVCPASWFLVSIYLIWILESKLILSNNQSRATLWVLETCLIVELVPLIIILITASLSSNTYNKASRCENRTFEGTKSTLSKSLITPWDWWRTWFLPRQTTGLTVLSWFCCVSKNCDDEIPKIKSGSTA